MIVNRAGRINDSGQAVGSSYLPGDTQRHAVIWNGTTPFDLGALVSGSSQATGINNLGQVVGTALSQATLWSGFGSTTLSTLGGTIGGASDINNAGHIVGISATSTGEMHATLWVGGANPTDLGTLGGSYSQANDINNVGQIVGYSSPASGGLHATLWKDGIALDLNFLIGLKAQEAGWVLNRAYPLISINDSGVIAGTAYNTLTGQNSAFVLTPSPVPLPASLPLLVVGTSSVLAFLRRRRSARTN